jgi:hypothetical protein
LHWNYTKPDAGIVEKTAAYPAPRTDHDVSESLKVAAAVVLIKIETPDRTSTVDGSNAVKERKADHASSQNALKLF